MVYADTSTLSQISQTRFQQFDTSVEEGFAAIDRFERQLAGDLRTIRDEALFKEAGFATFEEYCESKEKWGGYRRINQLLAFGQVKDTLKGTGFDDVVKRESHARPVLRLVSTPEKLLEAVAIASQQNPNPTAKDFREAAQKVVPITKKPKVQEQFVPEVGASISVVAPEHPRCGQSGTICGDPENHTHLFIVFPDTEGSELVAIKDLDAPSSAFTPRRYPKEYEEAIAQIKLQHSEELRRVEAEVRAGLLVEAEERGELSVRQQLEASQAIASNKALEVAKLQQRVDELESLRTLEVENQQLHQRIGDLERALEIRPVQEWSGNTFTKEAKKALNAEVVKMVESREPELHLRSLATSPPTDATEALRLMSLAMGQLAKALNDTQVLSAAAILLKCNPTPEAVAIAVARGNSGTIVPEFIPTEQNNNRDSIINQVIADIRSAIASGCDWNGFWAIASNHLEIKNDYWLLLTPDERNLINKLKRDFDDAEKEADEAVQLDTQSRDGDISPSESPWLLTPQSWQSGGRSCKYVRMGELSLLFNDEKWMAIKPIDQEKCANPRDWLDCWEQGEVVEGAIAHLDVDKKAYTYHGAVVGVNPDLQEVRVEWQEIPDARWYEAHNLRVTEAVKK